MAPSIGAMGVLSVCVVIAAILCALCVAVVATAASRRGYTGGSQSTGDNMTAFKVNSFEEHEALLAMSPGLSAFANETPRQERRAAFEDLPDYWRSIMRDVRTGRPIAFICAYTRAGKFFIWHEAVYPKSPGDSREHASVMYAAAVKEARRRGVPAEIYLDENDVARIGVVEELGFVRGAKYHSPPSPTVFLHYVSTPP